MRKSTRSPRRWLAAALIGSVLLAGCQWVAPGPVDGPEPQDQAAKTPAKDLQDDMRIPWSREDGGFVRQWLLCGGFPNPPRTGADPTPATGDYTAGAGFDVDYLQAGGGEAAARPKEAQTVARPDGSQTAWKPYVSDHDDVDLQAAFPDHNTGPAVAYAFTTIRRATAGQAVLALGSDDSVKVYLNGQLVHDHRVARAVTKDEDLVGVTLNAGDNALLMKIENGRAGWGLVLRVLSASQAAALASSGPQPRIDPSPDGKGHLLAVRTDAGSAGLPRGDQAVRVEVVAPGGRVVGSAQAPRGEGVRFDTTPWPDGPYEVRVRWDTPEGHRVYRHLPWYKGDWRRQAIELLNACDKLPPRPAAPAELRLRVIGQLVLDRLGSDPRTAAGSAPGGTWSAIHSPLMEHAEVLLGPGGSIRPLGLCRLTWRDEVDDSPQYARAYLPAGYDARSPGKGYPMIVVLHGYNPPNPEYVRWWSVTRRHNTLCERHNVIVLEPHGRGNTSYNGIGDADVLRAIGLAKKAFHVDSDRVYLTGYSMGGGGTWHIGTRHPGLFAAIAPIYGGWDYHQWMKADELAKLTPQRKYEMESWSSFAQAESLLTTPIFVNHGDADDLVDVKYSRYVVRMLQRWGYNLRYWEHPGKGHGRLDCEDELVRWFKTHTLDRNPRRVRVRSARLKDAAAHWVRVAQREDPFAFIRVDARVVDRRTIRLDTANVLQVRLSPGEALVDPARPVRVIWNGADTGGRAFDDGAITLRAAGYRPTRGAFHKKPLLAGPIEDATTTPFLIVVGTASPDAAMRRFCRLRAEAARDEWKQWQKVTPRYLPDTEVTAEHIRTYSLLLFGGPDENLVTRKIAQYVTMEIKPHWITLGGQVFPAENASLAMVCPNPFNPDRYVSIMAGNSPAGMYFANRLPGNYDFAIADARAAERVPFEELCIAAGRFDPNWQFNEKYTVRGTAEARNRVEPSKAPTALTAAVKDPQLMLADLLETDATGSFVDMARDTNWRGRPIRLGREVYDHGIGVNVWHEPCAVRYDLAGGSWKRLRATIGIELKKPPEQLEPKEIAGTRVFFVVLGDGKELYRSPTFQTQTPPVKMDVDITGVKTLELRIGNQTTWHNAAASVNWANIRLEK